MFPIRDTIPSRQAPVMTWSLIALNVAVFLLEWSLPTASLEGLFHSFGLVPARYFDPGWASAQGFAGAAVWPFLTSMFLHGGFFHLAGNMWMLWIFGDNVEDRMGRLRFLLFYLLCGLAAALLHLVTNAGSTLPTVGASGAISGVLGAYLVLYPRARVLAVLPIVFWPIFFELPAVLFLGLWFVAQLLSGTLSAAATSAADVGGVAWWAHVGGFVAGILLHRLFLRRNEPTGELVRHFVLSEPPSRRPPGPWKR